MWKAEEDAQAQIGAAILERARRLKDGESEMIEFPVRGQHDEIPHGLAAGLLGDRDRLDDNLATGRTRVKIDLQGHDQSERGRAPVTMEP